MLAAVSVRSETSSKRGDQGWFFPAIGGEFSDSPSGSYQALELRGLSLLVPVPSDFAEEGSSEDCARGASLEP